MAMPHYLCMPALLLLMSAAGAAAPPSRTVDLLAKARAGPMQGVGEVVFAVRTASRDVHWYANFGYWAANPDKFLYEGKGQGTQLCRASLRTNECRALHSDPDGTIRDPRVHYDGGKILFSYRKGGTRCFNLYEINADGTGLRQLTAGPWDDIEPCYLPSGDIVFVSSRCRRWVPCYQTQVAIIYRCDRDGRNIHPISCNVEHDNTPAVMPDGRILYTRWEYTDRSQIDFHHLWTFNPDGTGAMTWFGNMHRGGLMLDARPVPGTNKAVNTFFPGHSTFDHKGAIVITDPDAGPDDKERVAQISPGGPFNWWRSGGPWRDPYPFSEDCVMVAEGNRICLMNGQGDVQTIYSHRGGPAGTEVQEPQPLVARPREPVIPDRADWAKETGRFVLADVRHGRNMEGVAAGEIRKLLVLEILPKPINFSGGSDPLAERGSFFLQRILGTVPVEADGSACFDAPALRPIFFVALDEKDLSVKRMQSFTSVMPGETVGCAGCHENRQETPRLSRTVSAVRRPPSRIEPIADVPQIIDLARHIQPVLDKHCVSCHNYDTKRDGGVALVGDRGPIYTHSYTTLIHRKLIVDGANAVGNTPPRQIGSSASRLMRLLDGSHYGAKLSERERAMVRLWIDTGAIYAGTYAALGTGYSQVDVFQPPAKYTAEQHVLRDASAAIRTRCVGCHRPADANKLPGPSSMPAVQTSGGPWTSSYFARVSSEAHAKFSPNILFNLTRPDKSPILLAPLSKTAGGWGACCEVDAGGRPSAPKALFPDTADPDYRKILAAIAQAKARLDDIKRFDMPGFRPGEHYVREMKRYGVLPTSFDPATDPADVYAIDEKYWQSFWWRAEQRREPAAP